jgi:hypothetical protein
MRATIQRRQPVGGTALPPLLFGLAGVVACASILWLGRRATFFNDEWNVLEARSLGDPTSWLTPHNGHWHTGLVVMYRLIVETMGVTDYLPYLAVLLAFHLVVALAVYYAFSDAFSPAAPWLGLAAALLILFLGSGADDLFWAYQMGFVASTAMGLWAMLLLRRPGEAAGATAATASVLLLGSVATSGIGLCFLVAAGVLIALQPGPRNRVLVVAPAIVAYLAWFAVYGASAQGTMDGWLTLSNLASAPGFALRGVANSVGGLSGLGDLAGAVILWLGMGWLLVRVRHGWRVPPMLAAALVGTATEFVLAGLLRAGSSAPEQSRYIYPAAALLLVGLASLGPSVQRVPQRSAVIAGVAVATAVALAVNLGQLTRAAQMFGDFGELTRACEPSPPMIDGGEAVEIAVLTCYVNRLPATAPASTLAPAATTE